MRVKYLIFGDGLLGNFFKFYDDSAVLSKDQCDITSREQVKDAINYYRPETVVNCAGIVPRNPASIEMTFKVNSFAPHMIADMCYHKAKFIHISTDCVFSGEKGQYVESDKPDATDIYGMSKIFGEPQSGLTIRTSFVGLPDVKRRGLLAWASEQTEVTGYDKVFWNGVTPLELIRKVREYSETGVTGIRHVYSYTVSKYELLICAKDVFNWLTVIYPESDKTTKCHSTDKTLNSVYATGFVAKPIRRQLEELKHYV